MKGLHGGSCGHLSYRMEDYHLGGRGIIIIVRPSPPPQHLPGRRYTPTGAGAVKFLDWDIFLRMSWFVRKKWRGPPHWWEIMRL